MMTEDEVHRRINDYIKASIENYHSSQKDSKFEHMIKSEITNLMLKFVSKWVAECFKKYDQNYFHTRMGEGFDFVQDMKDNHRNDYRKFIFMAKKLRKAFYLDPVQIFNSVMGLLLAEGWNIYDFEQVKIWSNILEIKSEIDST